MNEGLVRAFEDALKKGGMTTSDDEFNCYHLDYGNLFWLWGEAWNTRATETKLQQENERLREALQFYRAEKAYYHNVNHPATLGRCILDKGYTARQALAQCEEG